MRYNTIIQIINIINSKNEKPSRVEILILLKSRKV